MLVQQLASTQEAIQALEAYLEVIFGRANSLSDEHWDYVYAYDKKMPDWRQKSRLFLRCRKVGNSLQIEWYEVRWVGPSGNRKYLRHYISKPRGQYGYNIGKLIPLARDWEVERVKETEAKMAAIRREAGQVNRALTALRAYVRAEGGGAANPLPLEVSNP
jgi:hypothetical protein